MKSMMLAAALASLTFGCTPAFAQPLSVSLDAGKMLNNTNSTFPGYVGQIELAVAGPKGFGLVARYAKVSTSHLSEYGNETFVNVAVTSGEHPWQLSVGPALYMNYDTSVKWHGKIYPAGGDGIHSRYCTMCGLVSGIEYRFPHSAFSVSLQYYAVQRISPTFQGGIALIKYTIGNK